MTDANSMPASIDDLPIASTAKAKDATVQRQRRRLLIAAFIVLTVGLLFAGFPPTRVLIAMTTAFFILSAGMMVLGALARPIPDPPPPGELRKVKLAYRCELCGAELKMTLANDEVPDPPRHCGEQMIYSQPVEL